MFKKTYLSILLLTALLFVTALEARAASPEKQAYEKAVKKFYTVVNGKTAPKEVLDALMAADKPALSLYEQGHCAMYIGDLYYRLGDYDKCREWLLKILDDKEFYDIPVSSKASADNYKHGLAVAVVLANAAAEFGKPEDIEMIENKISKDELSTRVSIWYCWINKDKNTLRTLLRFYKALAYKNAGNTDAMNEVFAMSNFKTGKIRVENKEIPLKEAADQYLGVK